MVLEKKRLVFNFDGTWNRLDAPCPTNVVLTAESVLPLDSQGVAQLNYYDQGVGTGKWDRIRGGVFGMGLMDNLADAYRHLIFNYTPGDEIFVFGFSRGAFSARSFVGLLRNCGIVARCHAARVTEAIALYTSRAPGDAPWGERAEKFRADYVPTPVPDITYLGVWDTVGALGIPNYHPIARFFNGKYRFHDTDLSDKVKSARHAVAIDETRRDFEPALWTGFDEMNRKAGKDRTAADAPYQQKWFPGVHCSVGGGGDYRGLSDQALEWVWAGARLAGLELDVSPSSRVYSLKPNFMDPLGSEDLSKLGRFARFKAKIKERLWVRAPRQGGPTTIHHVSIGARRRWHAAQADLPEEALYRPPPLKGVEAELGADAEYANAAPLPEAGTFEILVVEHGDSLSKIARDRLGDAKRWPEIFEMNRDKLADPNRIYCGMTLRIPKPPANL
jgi:uncharacterized protein (DUF2235 family)